MRRATAAVVAASPCSRSSRSAAAPAEARRDRTVTGDVIKAARFLQTTRLDDARALLAELEKRAPDAPRSSWLEAELAFQTGDYAGAIKLLDKVPDDAVDGLVGQTRQLAASTLGGDRDVRRAADRPAVTSSSGTRRARTAAIADLAGEVLERRGRRVGDDLGFRPPIRSASSSSARRPTWPSCRR